MRKIIITLIQLFLLLIFITSCFNKKNNDEYVDNINEENDFNENYSEIDLVMPVALQKIESLLGTKISPLFSKITNIDNDIDEEFLIAYLNKDDDFIKLAFFDLLPSGSIRKKEVITTAITEKNNFSFSEHNLFFEDDICLIIEGKKNDNKWILLIYSYINEEYKLIHEFTGDYSVMIDYKEVEDQTKKYHLLKEIMTINNTFSSTNTNIQEKKVYVWDYTNKNFKIVEISQILSNDTTIDKAYLRNTDKFLEYISGFWYPEKYEDYIKNKNFDLEKFNTSNTEFIKFSSIDKEVCIKKEDYMNNFVISKFNITWGHGPGLRLKVKSSTKSGKFTNKIIEVFLVEKNRLLIKGPKEHDEVTYVRLAKPFIEYVADKRSESIFNETERINKYLNEEFIEYNSGKKNENTDDNVGEADKLVINFEGKNNFLIKKGSKIEKGIYKIHKDNLGIVITFLFESKNTILMNNNYLIEISKNNEEFKLTPVKISFHGYELEDVRETLKLIKRNRG